MERFWNTRLYSSNIAVIIKYHQLGGLNNWNLFSHRSGDWEFMIRCQPVWFLARVLSLQCQPPACCVPLRLRGGGGELLCLFLFLSWCQLYGIRPSLMTSFNLCHSLQSQILSYWGLGLWGMNFEENTNIHSIMGSGRERGRLWGCWRNGKGVARIYQLLFILFFFFFSVLRLSTALPRF